MFWRWRVCVLCSEWIHTSPPSCTTGQHTHHQRSAAVWSQTQCYHCGEYMTTHTNRHIHTQQICANTWTVFFSEWKHSPCHRSSSGLHLSGGHIKSDYRGGHYYNNSESNLKINTLWSLTDLVFCGLCL